MDLLTNDLWRHLVVTPSIERHYVATVRRRVRQALCGIHGHELLFHFERGRICLRCIDCGYETTGWSLN